jgi:hypothetical protein
MCFYLDFLKTKTSGGHNQSLYFKVLFFMEKVKVSLDLKTYDLLDRTKCFKKSVFVEIKGSNYIETFIFITQKINALN